MCARFTVFTEEEIIEIRSIIEEVSRKFGDGAVSKGEIRPTNTAPVLALDNDRITPYPVSWGFPKRNGKGVDINARTDTILNALVHPEKRSMWREPILTRRCVIPSTGFYEWAYTAADEPQTSLYPVEQKPIAKSPKTKLFFKCPDKSMLYMAGMLDTFIDKDGKPKDAFIILTTAANASMAPYHHRMPVVLQQDELEEWLQDDKFMQTVLERMCPALIMTLVIENAYTFS